MSRSSLRAGLTLSMCLTATAVGLGGVAQAQMGEVMIHGMFLAEQLEYRYDGGANPVAWDVMAWVGGDINRVWLKSEGEVSTDTLGLEGEAQLLYSRLVTPNWELQVGLRGDLSAEADGRDGRGFVVLGMSGLAPHWFEMAPSIFVSHRGDVSGRLAISYELYITQRLIAEPDFELNVAIQSVPEAGVGAGVNDLELGLRLRYELRRELAPYVGVSWQRRVGKTAEMARAAGESPGILSAMGGLRFWF